MAELELMMFRQIVGYGWHGCKWKRQKKTGFIELNKLLLWFHLPWIGKACTIIREMPEASRLKLVWKAIFSMLQENYRLFMFHLFHDFIKGGLAPLCTAVQAFLSLRAHDTQLEWWCYLWVLDSQLMMMSISLSRYLASKGTWRTLSWDTGCLQSPGIIN